MGVFQLSGEIFRRHLKKSKRTGSIRTRIRWRPDPNHLRQSSTHTSAGVFNTVQANLLQGTAILITRGALGMSCFRHGSAPFHVPAVARNVFDVTGAGDTVISTLAVALATHATLEQGIAMASHAAGVVVERLGTATVTAEDLRNCITLTNKKGGTNR